MHSQGHLTGRAVAISSAIHESTVPSLHAPITLPRRV